MMCEKEAAEKSQCYQIQVLGTLDAGWENWLNGHLETCTQPEAYSQIIVAVPDQSALRGVLNKIWDLNLTLISVVLLQDAAVPHHMEVGDEC